jgi:hypothetical protein
MTLLLPSKIWALKHVIAPHGITDIVHARVHQNYCSLVVVYGGSTAAGWLLHATHHDVWLYCIFAVSSVVHFRNDFVFPKWMLSTVVLTLMLQPSQIDAIFFYMMVLHVPNHYRAAWRYVKKQKCLTLGLLLATGFWCDAYLVGTLLENPTFILSIVVGHVVYQEFVALTNTKSPP